jgi:hypothetical protein
MHEYCYSKAYQYSLFLEKFDSVLPHQNEEFVGTPVMG